MRQKITKTAVDSLRPKARDAFLWDAEITGFGCKITPAGRKVYILQYRTENQDSRKAPKRVTLGKHGDITFDKARKLATRGTVKLTSPPRDRGNLLGVELVFLRQLRPRPRLRRRALEASDSSLLAVGAASG